VRSKRATATVMEPSKMPSQDSPDVEQPIRPERGKRHHSAQRRVVVFKQFGGAEDHDEGAGAIPAGNGPTSRSPVSIAP